MAASQGDPFAQHNLGLMYEEGSGTAQDYIRSHMWSNLSAAQGDKDAVVNRNNVAKLMTPQQIAEAQQLASACLAKNLVNCD